MKKINKQEIPAFFSDYIKKHKPKVWNDIAPVRSDLRKEIWSEQGQCCAYTEILLPNHDSNGCHIDHFKKRDLYPQFTFEYTNLLASCNSENYGAKYKDKQVKSKNDYADLINPVEESSADYIKYTFDGKAVSRNKSPKGDKTIVFFNLNEKSLLERRRVVASCLFSVSDFSEDEVVNDIGQFETMIRQLYKEL